MLAATAIAAIGLAATVSPAMAAPFPVIAAPTAAPPLKVLFIGDSVMKAFGLDITQSWPVLLGQSNGWDVTNLASNGSGYVARGESDNNFLDVVQNASAQTPDVVVLEGSSNDFGIDNGEISDATSATFAAVQQEFPSAVIIGLSTIWGAEAIPDQLADTNAQVQSAVEAVGGQYLDIGQPFQGDYSLMQDDDVHPTTAGQVALSNDIDPGLLTAIAADRAAKLQAEFDARIEAELSAGAPARAARLEMIAKLAKLN